MQKQHNNKGFSGNCLFLQGFLDCVVIKILLGLESEGKKIFSQIDTQMIQI